MTDDEKRELIAKSRKYAKKKRGDGWLEVADTVDRLADALEGTLIEPEWEYTWAGLDGEDEWVLDAVFPSQGEAVEFLRQSGWILMQGGALHRRHKAGPWEVVTDDRD